MIEQHEIIRLAEINLLQSLWDGLPPETRVALAEKLFAGALERNQRYALDWMTDNLRFKLDDEVKQRMNAVLLKLELEEKLLATATIKLEGYSLEKEIQRRLAALVEQHATAAIEQVLRLTQGKAQ